MDDCTFCGGHGRLPAWIEPTVYRPGHWRLFACIVCGVVLLPEQLDVARFPQLQYLPTRPTQEAHTQPGESEAAAQDVRSGPAGFNWTCQLCAQEVALGEQYRTIGPGGHVIHDGAACVVAAERARIRAAVEARVAVGDDWDEWPQTADFLAMIDGASHG